ncbi:MAG: hypothetical protein JWM76_1992 [Pseudonocardiales bacterium]|nr:hypothetical protein [Pseudonocardiales bacterium]
MVDLPPVRAQSLVYELVTLRLFGDEDLFINRLRRLCADTSEGEPMAVHVMNEMVNGILASEPRERLILTMMAERLESDVDRPGFDPGPPF